MPQQLQSALSSRYARRLTLVKTFASCSEIPGGSAFFRFLNFFLLGRPSSLVAGTCSKYGSYRRIVRIWETCYVIIGAAHTSVPNLFCSVSLRIFLPTNFAITPLILAVVL